MWQLIYLVLHWLKHIFDNNFEYSSLEDAAENLGLTPDSKIKNLHSLNEKDIEIFFESFDHVICDCDGVLWQSKKIIPGVDQGLKVLENRGKQLHFLTNNNVNSFDEYKVLFQKVGINIKDENLFNPSKAVINYLKAINFKKSLFVIGSSNLIKELEAAGISCLTAENESPENLKWFLEKSGDNKTIGAVFIDFDVNFNYLKLNKAVSLLERQDVLFLVGSVENYVLISDSKKIIGPGPFVKIVSNYSNREAELMGKPSPKIKEIILKQFNITNPERTLFIGDSFDTDMAFADLCNFKKLLVFSGVSSARDLLQSKKLGSFPNYTLNSLTDLATILPKGR